MTNPRLTGSKCAIGVCFLAAAFSQAKLQTVESEHTIALANETKRYELSRPDPAARGILLSADGVALAKDEAVYDLQVDFKKCPKAEGFWLELSAACGIPRTEFAAFQDSGAKGHVWQEAILDSQRDAVDEVRALWRTNGVSARTAGRRMYPLGEATACLVGVLRRNGLVVGPQDREWNWALRKYGPAKNGLIVGDLTTGLEASQDSILCGTDGVRTGVTDRNGHFLPMRVQSGRGRVDGQNVTLTLDSQLQELASQSIKKAVADNEADCGVALVMDPKTGNVLAMANWPSFEPYTKDGDFGSMGAHGGLNQAYMSCFEPGSMFKILTLAKALDEGVVHMTDEFNCPGEMEVVPGTKPIRCDSHHGVRAQGRLDPELAIAKSCNIWAAIWAKKVGYKNFISFLDQLELFKKPSMGVPGAISGLFNRNDPAKVLQVANVGFGQSINCTPVALLGAFSTLANHGVFLPPRIIAKVGSREVPVGTGKKVLTDGSCQNVLKGMKAVFGPRGTGRTLVLPGYSLAGKTGTAQKLGKNDTGNVSNFVGFVPAENTRAVVLVMVNKPRKGQIYGADVAGPVFLDLAKAIIRKYHIPSDPALMKHAPVISATRAHSTPSHTAKPSRSERVRDA